MAKADEPVGVDTMERSSSYRASWALTEEERKEAVAKFLYETLLRMKREEAKKEA